MCYKGTRAVLGSWWISTCFLTMELIKNFCNLPYHYFDLESKRKKKTQNQTDKTQQNQKPPKPTTCKVSSRAGATFASCPIGLHCCCWRVGSAGARVSPPEQRPQKAAEELARQTVQVVGLPLPEEPFAKGEQEPPGCASRCRPGLQKVSDFKLF